MTKPASGISRVDSNGSRRPRFESWRGENRLELSYETTGKIAFLAKLKLVSADNRRFIDSYGDCLNWTKGEAADGA